MKRKLVLLAILLEGVVTGLMVGLLLPAEQREKLSQQLASAVGGMLAYVPDE